MANAPRASVRLGGEVTDALRAGAAVVALETAVLTHGLPRVACPAPPAVTALVPSHRWNEDAPAHRELARAMAAAVRAGGAIPATVGVLDGELIVGLDDCELGRLADAPAPDKVAERDLAATMVAGRSGGTTVAGTLAALAIAASRGLGCMRVFATGGIGGVHRGWTLRPDISADLLALATTPVAVVSAGAKSILDLPATIEALDALSVPVLGLDTPWFPRFLSAGAAPLTVQREVADVEAAAAICHAHWNLLGRRSGVLVAQSPPAEFALAVDAVESIIAAGVADAERRGLRGPAVTPHLLAHLNAQTGGASMSANIAALLANARTAASMARSLAAIGRVS